MSNVIDIAVGMVKISSKQDGYMNSMRKELAPSNCFILLEKCTLIVKTILQNRGNHFLFTSLTKYTLSRKFSDIFRFGIKID